MYEMSNRYQFFYRNFIFYTFKEFTCKVRSFCDFRVTFYVTSCDSYQIADFLRIFHLREGGGGGGVEGSHVSER